MADTTETEVQDQTDEVPEQDAPEPGNEETSEPADSEAADPEATAEATDPGAEDPEAAGSGAAGPGAGRKETRRGRDPVRAVALVLACVAAVAAAWSGWRWYDTAHDDTRHYAELRDEVLQSGEQAIVNLNTLDYRALEKSLKSWQDSSTSDLYRDIVQGRDQFEEQVREARTITSARILAGAVSELDEHSGKARIIVAVQLTVTPPTGQPATKQSRQIGELTRTAAGWKLSALGQAPVGGSGS